MNKSNVMMVGPSGVGETVEGKVKEALDNQEISFITLPDASDSAEVAGQIRRPWQIMDHLITWDRRMDFDLVCSSISKDAVSREQMISGDLADMKEIATGLARDYGASIQLFYGEEVPDVDANRQNATMCYKLLKASRQVTEEIHDIFRKSDHYAQIRYDYLARRGHREYLLNGEALYFAMTPRGLDLFRDFLMQQYDLLINGQTQGALEALSIGQNALTLKLRRAMHSDILAVKDNLRQAHARLEKAWRELMVDSGQPITESNAEAGESVYSMVQFERMMAERRGEDWHNWL